MSKRTLKKGDRVKLIAMPTGQFSSTLPLTVGNIYILRYLDGSNVCTSTDRPGLDGHYHRDRVVKVSDEKT